MQPSFDNKAKQFKITNYTYKNNEENISTKKFDKKTQARLPFTYGNKSWKENPQ